MNREDWTKRKRAEESLISFLSFLEVEEIPSEYLSALNFSYSGGGECWLHLIPQIEFTEEETKKVVEFFSYINPDNFPPKEEISSINFSEIRGGKSRRCTKGVQCGGSCVSSKKECKKIVENERLSRKMLSRSKSFRKVSLSETKRVNIKTPAGGTFELSTDRPFLAQRFYDQDYMLPSDTKATVVSVVERRNSTQITLQDLSFRDRKGDMVTEDHVNLFLRKEEYVRMFQKGRKYQISGLEIEQYRNDPDRFGVRSEDLKVTQVQDYSE